MMTRNDTVARHGSSESSWSSRSGDTVRPYGRQGSLRGTPVTVKTPKDHSQYVFHPMSTELVVELGARVGHGHGYVRCAPRSRRRHAAARSLLVRLQSLDVPNPTWQSER
jgi:hypothetical protein